MLTDPRTTGGEEGVETKKLNMSSRGSDVYSKLHASLIEGWCILYVTIHWEAVV